MQSRMWLGMCLYGQCYYAILLCGCDFTHCECNYTKFCVKLVYVFSRINMLLACVVALVTIIHYRCIVINVILLMSQYIFVVDQCQIYVVYLSVIETLVVDW